MRTETGFENEAELEGAIAQLLREKGVEHEETAALLREWILAQEAKAAASADPMAGVRLDMRRAKLYAAGGYTQDALDSLEAARQQAYCEYQDELVAEIDSEIKNLKA